MSEIEEQTSLPNVNENENNSEKAEEKAEEAVKVDENPDLEPGEIVDDGSEPAATDAQPGVKRYTNPLDDPRKRAHMKRLIASQQGHQRRTVSVVKGPREPRHEQPKTATIREDTLHLYGTDSCSTDQVFAYFAKYQPKFVEWIDDSSCNVVFPSAEAASLAMKEKKLETQEALQTSFEQHLKFDPVTMELVVSSSTNVRKHKRKAQPGETAEGTCEDEEMNEGTTCEASSSETAAVEDAASSETVDVNRKNALLPWVRATPMCAGRGSVAKLEIRQATTDDVRKGSRPSRYYGELILKMKRREEREAERARIIEEADRAAMMPEDGGKGAKRPLQEVVFGDNSNAHRLMVDTTSETFAEAAPADGDDSTIDTLTMETKRKRRRSNKKRHDVLDNIVF